MSIAPIRQDVFVPIPQARAFALFTGAMERWWPHQGCADQAEQMLAVKLEPRLGGRWYRRMGNGTDAELGTVLAWEPPGRLVLGWQVDAAMRFDPALLTEVEIRFEPAEGGTLVALEHRNLERFGDSAVAFAQRIQGGWSAVLGGYVALAATPAEPVS